MLEASFLLPAAPCTGRGVKLTTAKNKLTYHYFRRGKEVREGEEKTRVENGIWDSVQIKNQNAKSKVPHRHGDICEQDQESMENYTAAYRPFRNWKDKCSKYQNY